MFSSDQASGRTWLPVHYTISPRRFQYPLRIDPLVERAPALAGRARAGVFQYPLWIEPLVERGLNSVSDLCDYLFQYPLRIEPLVERRNFWPKSSLFCLLRC